MSPWRPEREAAVGDRLFGLYGAGGFGREVISLARSQLDAGWRVVFVETDPHAAEVNGMPLLSEEAFFAIPAAERRFAVAIADSRARATVAQRCVERGARPLSLHADNAKVYDDCRIGEGAILCAYTTITSNVTIGRHFHANLYSYVAHDCVIGDHVTFAPRVSCNGNVHIGDHAYIGTGALLRPGVPGGRPLTVGEGAVVGMGAVVLEDVAPYTTVVG
ncbi:MAG: acetyltransferase [Pseudomonadota bacterium]|nr:acetyltransferase [Pseudomonadota bacterium]